MAAPRHHGDLPDATHVGAVGNPACGDVVTLYLRIGEDDVVEEARFESIGSPYQLATADVLCDCVTGETVAEAEARGPECVLKRLPDLPEGQRYLARLAIDALRRALAGRAEADPEADALPSLSQADSRRFVERHLKSRGRLRTMEMHALAESEGVALPGSTLRCLAGLRQEGVIQGEMDVEGRSWSWWSP